MYLSVKTKLELRSEKQYRCENTECGFLFPIINDIPILIDEDQSIFSFDHFVNQRNTTFYSSENKWERALNRFIPRISRNLKGKENYGKFAKLLLGRSSIPNVTGIGASILGSGMEALIEGPDIKLVESDVAFWPRTTLICDAYCLPFEDNSFDGVIVQAVLEHVVDSLRCVEEIYRVLKEDGLVYDETTFMQQVHGSHFDFTRFTHLGHRHLFRKFEEIASGAVCGPAMALAWSYWYFLLSFTTIRFLRRLLGIFARFTSFYLLYLDYLLINYLNILDAASAYYSMDRNINSVLSDRELDQTV